MADIPARTQDETRQKIMQAAGDVFADCGYQAATVRDICTRAGANVAAVNYHFGDKHGLYLELLKSVAQQSQMDLRDESLHRMAPERALRAFIHRMLLQLTGSDRPSWYTRVMVHELVKPTEALSEVVEHLIRPKAKILCGIVGQIIGKPPLHPRTRMCAQSVMGQVVHYVHARPVISLLWPDVKMNRKTLELTADHIAEFSLVGMKGIGEKANRGTRKKRSGL